MDLNAAALLNSSAEPSTFGTSAANATRLKLTTGYASLALMLPLLAAGMARFG